MKKFSAEQFVKIGSNLVAMENSGARDACLAALDALIDELKQIGCTTSVGVASDLRRIVVMVNSPAAFNQATANRFESLRSTIQHEMAGHLFLWVPATRADWHGRSGRAILGEDCLKRFQKSAIATEVEHAARCFAFGEYTASAFHLMRITEAGVRALAIASGYVSLLAPEPHGLPT